MNEKLNRVTKARSKQKGSRKCKTKEVEALAKRYSHDE
jgi:hypothetical protein